MKYSHEKHSIMHDLHRVESELQSAKSEIAKDKEEILSLREKMKGFHSSKILADKKVAESLAANSRLEVPIYLPTAVMHSVIQALIAAVIFPSRMSMDDDMCLSSVV